MEKKAQSEKFSAYNAGRILISQNNLVHSILLMTKPEIYISIAISYNFFRFSYSVVTYVLKTNRQIGKINK